MAVSAVSHHARSSSFPSISHSILSRFEDQLRRFRSNSEATSTSSSSSITNQLNGLQDLHDCVDEFLLLPSTQQSLSQDCSDSFLNGSLRLLDACSIIKDALLQTKESAQEIQSVMRRRCETQSEIKKYFSTRKMVKKTVLAALKSLKDMGNGSSSDNKTVALLGEAQAHTVLVFESLLSLIINGRKATSWSLVSKLTRKVATENEFAMVDAAVQSLASHKTRQENVQNKLQVLDSCIQDFEDILDSLFRRLIKNRVSLLNIINH